MSTATPSQPPPDGSLRRATARGFLWTAGQSLAVRGMSLIGFIVLARLLTPAEYGLAALANVFSTLLYMIGAAGLGQALVQRSEVDDTDLDTTFWIGTGLGTFLALVTCAAAWPLASVFHEPDLRPVLQVLSIGFVFIGLGTTQMAILQRRLDFKAIAQATLMANLIATIVGVAFAFAGFGVYSLVIQSLLGPLLLGIGNALQSGYRPGRNVSAERFRELFAYSRHLLGTSFMGFLNNRTDDFLIGSVLGSVALGIYTVGYRLLTVMLELLANTTRSVAFPVFSRLQGDRARLRAAYAAATRMASAIAFPVFLFVLVTAPVVIPTVFGAKWDRSVPVMQVLCLFGPQYAVMQFNSSLLQSVGRARLVFVLSVIGTALQVVFFAAAVNFGIVWVAAGFVLRAYLLLPVYFHYAARELETPMRTFLGGLVPTAVSSALMMGCVFAVQEALIDSVPGGLLLPVLLVVGAVAYLGALRVTGAALLAEALDYVRGAVSRTPATRESQLA